ncbi:hypothetical protein DFQ28_004255 [Apophysomyces sp. BC1034]|nr:hypothetical protein DFQ30_004241 [Apophysomyces sp. BC1015]KAG0177784.1 hypothetical protein DFQ29_004335 [Apophysomyces sp. BC1021]KAG0188851.1 hypothetical protein DFQ28_004255 [Apophysomyces sp. BC1034]
MRAFLITITSAILLVITAQSAPVVLGEVNHEPAGHVSITVDGSHRKQVGTKRETLHAARYGHILHIRSEGDQTQEVDEESPDNGDKHSDDDKPSEEGGGDIPKEGEEDVPEEGKEDIPEEGVGAPKEGEEDAPEEGEEDVPEEGVGAPKEGVGAPKEGEEDAPEGSDDDDVPTEGVGAPKEGHEEDEEADDVTGGLEGQGGPTCCSRKHDSTDDDGDIEFRGSFAADKYDTFSVDTSAALRTIEKLKAKNLRKIQDSVDRTLHSL